jgi:hypothetical protein
MLPQIHAAVEISSSVLESTAACVSLIKKSDTRQAYLVMIIIIVITTLNSGGRRNYCWSAGILSTRWSSGIRRSCCSDVVLIVSFTVDLQFLWSTSSTDNIDVLNGTSWTERRNVTWYRISLESSVSPLVLKVFFGDIETLRDIRSLSNHQFLRLYWRSSSVTTESSWSGVGSKCTRLYSPARFLCVLLAC